MDLRAGFELCGIGDWVERKTLAQIIPAPFFHNVKYMSTMLMETARQRRLDPQGLRQVLTAENERSLKSGAWTAARNFQVERCLHTSRQQAIVLARCVGPAVPWHWLAGLIAPVDCLDIPPTGDATSHVATYAVLRADFMRSPPGGMQSSIPGTASKEFQ